MSELHLKSWRFRAEREQDWRRLDALLSRAEAGGGWLRLAAPGEFLDRLLTTVGLTPRLGVYATVGDALAGRRPG